MSTFYERYQDLFPRLIQPFKQQPQKMVKHIQTIVRLALKGLISYVMMTLYSNLVDCNKG